MLACWQWYCSQSLGPPAPPPQLRSPTPLLLLTGVDPRAFSQFTSAPWSNSSLAASTEPLQPRQGRGMGGSAGTLAPAVRRSLACRDAACDGTALAKAKEQHTQGQTAKRRASTSRPRAAACRLTRVPPRAAQSAQSARGTREAAGGKLLSIRHANSALAWHAGGAICTSPAAPAERSNSPGCRTAATRPPPPAHGCRPHHCSWRTSGWTRAQSGAVPGAPWLQNSQRPNRQNAGMENAGMGGACAAAANSVWLVSNRSSPRPISLGNGGPAATTGARKLVRRPKVSASATIGREGPRSARIAQLLIVGRAAQATCRSQHLPCLLPLYARLEGAVFVVLGRAATDAWNRKQCLRSCCQAPPPRCRRHALLSRGRLPPLLVEEHHAWIMSGNASFMEG